MKLELLLLGGSEEIGANSCYLNIAGSGIIIDAGLHPRRRDALALPAFEHTAERAVDSLIITHAHTDHLGGLPYAMKHNPHLRILMTRATRDLAHIMLRSTARILKSEISAEFPPEALSLYRRDILRNFSLIFEGYRYNEAVNVCGRDGQEALQATFFDAGHILGSAGILLETPAHRIFHTGDVQFARQELLPGAVFPRQHLDVLISESTNGAATAVPRRHEEKKRLAELINTLSNANGSVLIPAFALGKTQEILKALYEMMRAGDIPHLPIYTGGISKEISVVYDHYCYAVPRVEPGFEVSDIPQIGLDYRYLLSGPYFKKPSIVVASSGMLNMGTTSWHLAQKWMQYPNFGIAFIGYLDEESPGYALLHSQPGAKFMMAGREYRRSCQVERFRFSSHAYREHLLDYIGDTRPKHLFLVHGDTEGCEALGAEVMERLPGTKVYIPQLGKLYELSL